MPILWTKRDRGGNRAVAILVGAALLLAPKAASAHVAFAEMGSFWAGVLYPLTSLDQVGFLLGLAVLVSFQQRRIEVRLIAGVFLGCVAGTLVGHSAGWPYDAGAAMAALMIVVGLAGVAALRLGAWPLIGLATAGGSLSGGSAGSALGGLSFALFSLGASTALASVLSYGMIATVATAKTEIDWTRIALRAGASWIATIGIMLLAFAGTQLLGHR